MTTSKFKRGWALGVTVAAGALWSIGAAQISAAADGADDVSDGASAAEARLEEVVVTARKRSEVAQNIPETIAAIGSKELENAETSSPI